MEHSHRAAFPESRSVFPRTVVSDPQEAAGGGNGIENPPGRSQESHNSEVPQPYFGLRDLFSWLHKCQPEDVQLPITVEFTTHGLRTTVTFERTSSNTNSGQISRTDE